MSTAKNRAVGRTRSMTGYGRGEAADTNGQRVVVELSSVNRRQFDFMASLPREFSAFESRLAALVRTVIRRGHVKAVVRFQRHPEDARGVDFDLPRAHRCLRTLREAGQKLGLEDNLELSDLLVLPGVFRDGSDDGADVEKAWTRVENAARKALRGLDAMRAREGRTLARDLTARLRRLKNRTDRIRRRAPAVTAAYREGLRKRLAEAGLDLPADRRDLLREIVLFAERCDISEELTRLASHVEQAQSQLRGEQAADGRTLDFLCQEMLREINTIGAKANDISIARCVIDFKSDLEAVREQAQNIE